jgi:hypothetical protein
MSRIDELQRMHEAHREGEPGSDRTAAMGHELFVELYYSWPAIHRVLVAARVLLEECDIQSDDPTVIPEFAEALRALDGGA